MSVRWFSITFIGVVVLVAIADMRGARGSERQHFPIPLGLMRPPIPDQNALTVAMVNLGERLFFEKQLSVDGTVSCGTCHERGRAFANGTSRSTGVRGVPTSRNSPTVLNAAFFDLLNWDGKALTLELQAKGALLNPGEMGMSEAKIVSMLAGDQGYRRSFLDVFREVSFANVLLAIAAYERTLLSGDSPFDRYMYGGEADAMSPTAKLGLEVFIGKGRCLVCHQFAHERVHPFGGRHALFSDGRFHNLGVGVHRASQDSGRTAITGNPSDFGKFKTPTLRNVALTAPYMHDGSLATLEAVVDFYDRGGEPNSNLDAGIRPLGLTQSEKRSLVGFLKALTDSRFEREGTEQGGKLHVDR